MKREEYKRTHSNPAMAFKNHCDYACPVEVYKQPSYKRSLFWYIVAVCLASLAVLSQVGCATALFLDDPTMIMEGPGLDVTWKK